MKNEIKNIMTRVFQIEPAAISDNIEMDKLVKWDSLSHLNLVVALEEKYQISFEPDEIFEMTNIEKIQEIITRKLNS